MSVAVAPLARRLEERARREPGFARVLEAIADAPTALPGTLERLAARELNEQRRDAVRSEFVEGSLPTPKVQELLGLGSPQAVHRLRSRGRLIGAAIGNQTWFPAWQFDADRIRPDLRRILELVAAFTTDPFAVDRIMRLAHDELAGRSIADALRRSGTTADIAWRMLASLGA